MTRSFSKKGLRRDLNFSDIIDPKQSLENLLNGLVQEEGETFVSADIEVIKNIDSKDITQADFANIAGSAIRVVNSEGDTEVYKPVITLKNRIDQSKYITGIPQLFGGNGLTGRYYSDSQVDSIAVDLDNIFTGAPAETEVFWENGDINLSVDVLQLTQSNYGGVIYTGFFKPIESVPHVLRVSTNSYFTVEFGEADTLLARKSQVVYTFACDAASTSVTTITLQNIANVKNLLIGDILVNNAIPQFSDPESNPITITGINLLTGVITISEPLDAGFAGGTTFDFTYNIGSGVASNVDLVLGDLIISEAYPIQIRFWLDDANGEDISPATQKTIIFNIGTLSDANRTLNYKFLYDEDYNINPSPSDIDYGEFNSFYDNHIPSYGGIVGGVSAYSDYQSVVSLNKLNITYTPPVSLSSAIRRTATVAFLTGTTTLAVSDTTDLIEPGNFVFGTGINAGTRVTDLYINSLIFISSETTATTASTSLVFINHRGLGAFESSATWSNSGTTITGLSTNTVNNILVGDVVVSNGSPTYNVVVTKGASSVTTSKAFTASSGSAINGTALFYRAKGLYNNSLTDYCTNVFSDVTTVQSNAGSNTLTIEDDTNLIAGQVVQFGTRIPTGTTVVSIVPSGSDFIITLSANIADDIPSGQLITFAPSGTTDSKEVCFPPIDTSPPFTATSTGLITTSGRPSMKIEPTITGTGELKFQSLKADSVTVVSASVVDTYDRTIAIKDLAGATFKILGKIIV